MKKIPQEIVCEQKQAVKVDSGVVITSRELVKAMQTSIATFNMAHGSHKQHSSSGEYGKN